MMYGVHVVRCVAKYRRLAFQNDTHQLTQVTTEYLVLEYLVECIYKVVTIHVFTTKSPRK